MINFTKFLQKNPKQFRAQTARPFRVTKLLNQGFTMVEMLVVIGIFSVLTAVVVFQYGQFNSQTIMTNMAYEVALATRQAQVFSLGVRGQSGNTNFENRYGVYFNLGATNGTKDFIFFIDIGDEDADDPAFPNSLCDENADTVNPGSGNCFACLAGSECLDKFTLRRDIVLDRICLSNSNPVDLESGECTPESEQIYDGQVTITFDRPNPDAIIHKILDGSKEEYHNAAIILSTKFGDQRAVIVKSTGQISIEVLPDKE